MPRNAYDKAVTLNKRKRGILRKAIELCNMCDQEMYIAIFDRKKNILVQYKSNDIMMPSKLLELQSRSSITHERYDNSDYEDLESKFLTKEKLQ